MSHGEPDVTPEELAAAELKVKEQLKDKMEATPENAAYWLE